MDLVSFEVISLLLSIFLLVRFKLHQKFILWLFKSVKIYLPPNDKDYDMIIELRKNKNYVKGQGSIARICEMKEYFTLAKDDNMTEADILLFFI